MQIMRILFHNTSSFLEVSYYSTVPVYFSLVIVYLGIKTKLLTSRLLGDIHGGIGVIEQTLPRCVRQYPLFGSFFESVWRPESKADRRSKNNIFVIFIFIMVKGSSKRVSDILSVSLHRIGSNG